MRKIDVKDKSEIKLLLYCNFVIGVKDHRYRSFGGFQLWWYDKRHDICNCCQSRWSETRKTVERYSLNQAAKLLWQSRNSLFLRGRRLGEDKELTTVGRTEASMGRTRCGWSVLPASNVLAPAGVSG